MTRDKHSDRRSRWRQRLRTLLALNIRGKIILPYFFLTVVVAIVGTYVVTSLVAGSLDERLTNHLLEAGRTVSDGLAVQEVNHLETARIVAYTVGLAEALDAHDSEDVTELAQPAAIAQGAECLILVDADGQMMLHLLRRDGGRYDVIGSEVDTSGLWMVQALLETGDPNSAPKRGAGMHPVDGRYYYYSAIPIPLQGKVVGVVTVGTSFDTLASYFEATSLAGVVLYLDGGRIAAATVPLLGQPAEQDELLEGLYISPEEYQQALLSDETTVGTNFRIEATKRWYRTARGPLRVADDRLGVFAVTLPAQFIVQAGSTSRNTYTALFSGAVLCVIVVGYLISRRITRPLSRLVQASRAVAEGDLKRRTGVGGTDEIGVLAETFDEMTGRLEDRTRALQELLQIHKETASRLQAILSSIGDGVLLEDTEGSFVPLNVAAEALLMEMSASFLLGPLRELSAGEDGWGSDAQPNPWLLDQRRFRVGKKTITVHSAAVRTDDGERLGTVIVLRDVTAEVEAEELKDAFITHVSHELRTPLTAIQGYTQLLLSGARESLDDEQRGFLDTIGRHTDSLVGMIGELLDVSEMQAAGRLALRQRPVPLSAVVKDIADEWRSQMDQKGLTFQVETPDGLPSVYADARRLRWAVVNLVRNAWQYTPSGGEVTLRLSARDGQVILDVVDTGEGISPEHQQQIFDRFYRVEGDSGEAVRGLGLGLYVTKAIVELHGGEIRVISEEGGGSTFSVILPALED